MEKLSLNENWIYWHEGCDDKQPVTLPHDAMLAEPRDADAPGGKNIAYFAGKNYVYERTLTLQKQEGSRYILEFEGVYRLARVYLNGEEIAFRPYGYTNFFIDITDKAKSGDNTLTVEAFNADQPNSRWYSGSGIYRPVWLYILPEKHILLDGVHLTTRDHILGLIDVKVKTSHPGRVRIEIYDGDKEVDSDEATTDGSANCMLHVKEAKLWSPDSPFLYTIKVMFEGDEQTFRWGLRQVECDSRRGLRINGKRVILRGACIHHDNGLLGACAYDFAEERKIRLLKEAGYNAIRSAHNPCSKAMLDACDRLGMLVMDEYVDMWYIHKTKYDYATYVDEWWQQDLKDMVEKDFNHPSVILYSTGNEVGETSEKRGIELTGRFTRYLHSLDRSRPVTCGVNIWFNAMYKMGFGQYSDKKAEKAAAAKTEKEKKKNASGSEFFNNLAGLVGAEFMKIMATLPICDYATRKAYANMDVAGYNYGPRRYKHDLEKYPDRIICGSETFVKDAATFYDLAQENPALIGDFVWAGMDYLGEVGLGAMEYKDYAPIPEGAGWIAAGSGRLDLTGKETAEAKYTKVAFGLLPIAIGVVPVNHTEDKHTPSAWSMTNAKESWSWNGCDGAPAKVEVYARCARVKLLINGEVVGAKKMKANCRAIFKTTYRSGTVEAIAYDKAGNEIARTSLSTAGDETKLTMLPEQESVKKNELLYVRMQYTDNAGTVKPLARGDISLHVTGGKLLGFGSACPYNERGYLTDTSDTYFGETLAVIQPTGSTVGIVAESPFGKAEASVPVE